MNDRIRLIRKHFGLNQKEFSHKINIGSSTLAMLEIGQRTIKDIHISQICSVFNVNEHWLRTGEGEMFKLPTKFSLDVYAKQNNLSDLDIEIVKIYMELDPEVRNQFLNKIQELFIKSTPPPKKP